MSLSPNTKHNVIAVLTGAGAAALGFIATAVGAINPETFGKGAAALTAAVVGLAVRGILWVKSKAESY